MLKKLLLTTALSGALIGVAGAQSNPPTDKPASPPAATQNQSDMKTIPTPAPNATQMTPSTSGSAATTSSSAANSASSSAAPKVVNSQRPDQFLASKFKGTDVLGANDEKIGDVSDILFEKDGKIQAYVVSVGGFLGIGSKHVALDPSGFQIVAGDKSKNESDKLKVAMTKDQLKQAADFQAYQAPRTTTGTGGAPSAPRPTQSR